MPFFDFLLGRERYGSPAEVNRMNMRRRFLIENNVSEIRGARVLDLASHDGRWCYAFAGAGASEVVGVEARSELVAEFSEYPDESLKEKINLKVNDLYDELDLLVDQGETFDVVGVFGIFYHVMDHYRMLRRIRALKPRLVIIDSEFMLRNGSVVVLVLEDPDNQLNTIALAEGQKKTPKGVPSFSAMEMMSQSLGWDCKWVDWNVLPAEERHGLRDYYRPNNMRRATCYLRPAAM